MSVTDKPVRLGMVGGGQGAFIGAVHRMAARLDGRYELLAGALSSDAERALGSAQELGLDPDRSYANFQDMIAGETARDDGIEAVAIVTPNHLHFPVAKASLEAGLHVICDKPLTTAAADAEVLIELSQASGCILAVTYNYSGTAMIRQAREMVLNGELGRIRVVQGEYAQDWMTQAIEAEGQKQASWRTDPARSGAGGCIGDIGTHTYHLACFVTGLEAEQLCAELSTFVEGRQLDDNAQVMLRFKGGARGSIWASQVAAGNENNLQIRVIGEKGSLTWRQEDPNYLIHGPYGEPPRRLGRGSGSALESAQRVTRIPAGHPEGYLESFANIYGDVAAAILAARNGRKPDPGVIYPTGEDGLRGVRFVEAAVESSNAGAAWVRL